MLSIRAGVVAVLLSVLPGVPAVAQPADAPQGAPCTECGRIAGTLREAGSDAPIAHATVRIVAVSGAPVSFATTGDDGRYESDALPSGTYTVATMSGVHVNRVFPDVECVYHCRDSLGAHLPVAAGATMVADFVLPRGASLGGRVTATDGTPAGGGEVVVQHASGEVFAVGVDPNGDYATPAILPAGLYRLRTTNLVGLVDEAYPDIPCVRGTCDPSLGSAVAIAVDAPNAIDFALAPGLRLRGRVTVAATGAPVPSGNVVFARPGGESFAVWIHADGRYDSGTGLPPSNWHLAATAPDLLGERWDGTPCQPCNALDGAPYAVIGTGAVDGIDFALDAGAVVAGRITRADDGTPVVGASIAVHDPDTGHVLAWTNSDASGDYASPMLLPADVTVRVAADGFLGQMYGASAPCANSCDPRSGAVVTAASGLNGGIDIALQAGGRLAGQVQAPDGTPVPDAEVVAMTRHFEYVGGGMTDAEGRFAIEGLVPGDHFLIAYSSAGHVATGWPASECMIRCALGAENVLHVTAAGIEGITLRFVEGGHVAGHVRDAQTAAAIAGVAVEVFTPDDHLVATTDPADATGHYRSPALPPGSYYLRAIDTGAYIGEAWPDVPCTDYCDNALLDTVAVDGGSDTIADFALDRGGRIAGRVDSSAGGTVAGAVYVLDGAGTVVIVATLDGDGRYLSDGVPAGTYHVRTRNRSGLVDELLGGSTCAWCPPAEVGAASVPVSIAQVSDGIDFVLDPGHRLGGRVLDEQGQPLSGAGVALHDAAGRRIAGFSVNPATRTWRSTIGLPPGTYFAHAPQRYQYLPALYDGAPCVPGNCPIVGGTPIIIAGPGETSSIDLRVPHGVLFGSDFEDAP